MDEKKPVGRTMMAKAIALKNACADTLYCEECPFYSVKNEECNINGIPSEWNISGRYKREV